MTRPVPALDPEGMVRVRRMRADREAARRAKSIEVWGHPGASVDVPYVTDEDVITAYLSAGEEQR